MNQKQVVFNKTRRRLCRLILAISMMLFCFPEEAISVTQTWQVTAGEDNCWCSYGINSCVTHDDQLYTGWNWIGGWKYSSGFRFASVDIPSGSTISSAYLKGCVAWAPPSGNVNAYMRGEAADNPDTFSTFDDFNNRPRTTAEVNWNITVFPDVGEWITSPDIAAIVQEIIDRPGWSSGNPMVIFSEGTSAGDRYFRVYGWDFNPNFADILEVTYNLVACEETETSLPSKNRAASLQIYPNPFQAKTEIKFQIADVDNAESVLLKIYDATGRLVKDFSLPTAYSLLPTVVPWNGTDDSGRKLPAGIYFVQLETVDLTQTEKVILLR